MLHTRSMIQPQSWLESQASRWEKEPRGLGADSTRGLAAPPPAGAGPGGDRWAASGGCCACRACRQAPSLSPSSSTPDCNVLNGIGLSLWRPLESTFITKLFPFNTFQEKEKHTHIFRKQKIGKKTIFITSICITVGNNGSDSDLFPLPVILCRDSFCTFLISHNSDHIACAMLTLPWSANNPSVAMLVRSS